MDKLIYQNKEVALINILRGGKDAESSLYAVPFFWAEQNDIKQYDWSDQDSVPQDIINKIITFPEVDITRIWTF